MKALLVLSVALLSLALSSRSYAQTETSMSGKGTLLLRTQKDGDRYTCGAVNTQGKFEHAFGYYVARCKMPKEPGHWPAFWMMCSGVGKVGNEGRDGTESRLIMSGCTRLASEQPHAGGGSSNGRSKYPNTAFVRS